MLAFESRPSLRHLCRCPNLQRLPRGRFPIHFRQPESTSRFGVTPYERGRDAFSGKRKPGNVEPSPRSPTAQMSKLADDLAARQPPLRGADGKELPIAEGPPNRGASAGAVADSCHQACRLALFWWLAR